MRKSHLLAALAAGVVVAASLLSMTLSGSGAAAQSPVRPAVRPQPAPPPIALLDVSHIFKKHARLKAMMDEMKQEVSRAEAWVKNENGALTKLKERLKDFRPGSPEFKSLEETVAKRHSELAIKIQQQKREFLQREAQIYHNVYREIQQEANYYCAAKGVAVVFRFTRQPAEVDDPNSVLGEINKPVVTYAKNLDITDLILSQLNRRPVGGNPNPIGTRQRPGVPFN